MLPSTVISKEAASSEVISNASVSMPTEWLPSEIVILLLPISTIFTCASLLNTVISPLLLSEMATFFIVIVLVSAS